MQINGVELAGRLNSRPFTGGPLNFFGEANYTYNRAIIEKGFAFDDDGDSWTTLHGNQVPEVPFHIAALTLASRTTPAGAGMRAPPTPIAAGSTPTLPTRPTAATAKARTASCRKSGCCRRVSISTSATRGASMFVAGDNLTNEFYITDREDGLKPGMGRTVWTGFKYKF